MVVDYPDIVGISGLPAKAHSPWVIDSDAEFAFLVSVESFQTIRWRIQEFAEVDNGIENAKFV